MGEGEMSEELKPCPFCGGEAELKIQRADEEHSYSFVRCKKCLVSTDHYDDVYPPGTDAVWRWNRRAAPPAAVPEGWVMVPREPTPEMDAAFLKTLDWMNGPTADQQREAWRQENRRRWALMIAAAPPPPSSDKEEADNA